MRSYFFGNMYLSSIQQGIQADHCSGEMFIKYAPRFTDTGFGCSDADKYRQMLDYHDNHKTDILLNAGYSSTLHEIYAGMDDTDNPYPFAKFHESEEALDGALTCVGIIVPDAIYDTAQEVRESRDRAGREAVEIFNDYGEWKPADGVGTFTFTKFQVWLINEMNKYPLAR